MKDFGFIEQKEKARDTNIELFRIILMWFMVAHHYVVNSGLTDSNGVIFLSPFSLKSIGFLLLGAFGKTGINCFVMITGYYMCKSNITVRKYVKLLAEVMFYRITIFIIFLIYGYEAISLRTILRVFIPVTQISTNFTGCFLAFFLFIPFINLLIRNMNERHHFYLLLLCGVIYVIIGTFQRTTINYVEWFFVIYLIASYIRIYPKGLYSNNSIWAIMMFLSIALLCLSVIFGGWIYSKNGRNLVYAFAVDSNSFFPVVIGITSFLFFKNLKIKYSKLINSVAASTFGVLCIHTSSDAMRKWLWRDILDNVGHYSLLHAIISVSMVFIICTIIDMIRIKLVEQPFFLLWDKQYPLLKKYIKKQISFLEGILHISY